MPILKVKNLTKMFGGVVALDNVSFEMDKAQILGLIGPNGAGKSTLLDVICGYLDAEAGEIWFNSVSLKDMKPYKRARLGISRTFQVPHLFNRMNVLENLLTTSNDLNLAWKILDQFELDHLAYELAENLSGGQQKLLGLARALMRKTKLLVADEPTAGMSPIMIDVVDRIIRELNDNGVGLIIVEHNMSVIKRFCYRCILLDRGHKIVDGKTSEVLENSLTVRAYLGRR